MSKVEQTKIASSVIVLFIKKKILTLSHLYDLLMILGNLIFAYAIGDKLYAIMVGKDQTASLWVAIFYGSAVLAYFAGLAIYCIPLKHCRAVMKIEKPGFTNSDQAAIVFTSVIFGLATALVGVSLAKIKMNSITVAEVLVVFLSFAAGAAVYILFFYATRIAGTGNGMNRKAYVSLLAIGFVLMFPLVIGIFGPVDAIGVSLDMRSDSSPASGIFELLVKAGARGALLTLIAWMLVFIIRKISSAPFGVKSNAYIFFIELFIFNTMIILLRYYNIDFMLFKF